MHAVSGDARPSPLRAAPTRATTPLPSTFGLVEDPSVRSFDDGRVILGGSPLRLFRLTERAHGVLDRWRSGETVGNGAAARLLARRFVSSGAFAPRPGAPTLTPDDVTVVIPVRDRPAQLARLLALLVDLRCIVVDDGSTAPAATRDVCARHGARLVALPVNRGPAVARNHGLAHVTTPIVAFVDSDCVPEPDWLDHLLPHFDDPLVAAAAPRIVSRPLDPSSPVARYEAVRSSLDRGAKEGPVRPGTEIPFVPSATLLVRTDMTSGGTDLFDPGLRGGEDVDLVWRLAGAGWDVRYVPASVVGHDGAVSAATFLRRRAFYGTSAGPLARRHGEAMAPLQTSVWSVAVWSLIWLRRPGLALTAQGASIVLLARRLRGLVRDPVAVAVTIAGGGTARSAVPALGSVARVWSPLLVIGLTWRRTRKLSALALLLPALRDRADLPGTLDPARYLGLHLADDLAYGAGVWVGCLRARTIVPLVPKLAWRSRTWSSSTLERDLGPTWGGDET